MEALDEEGRAQVDEVLQAWRQGDCVVGTQSFIFRTDIERPLTGAAVGACAEGDDTAKSEVSGFMVLTQTCDLVRSCGERPFIEVCPLVKIEDEGAHREIERGRRPRYAFIPGLADRRLVGDLDRVMTIEKGAVAGWERVEGCQTEDDTRKLALALARKRARFAFPDDFGEFAAPLMCRMSSKHDKQGPEGRALRALREIRVRAQGSWDEEKVSLTFWFIRDPGDSTFEGQPWDDLLEKWEAYLPEHERFVNVQVVVQTLDDLSARDYVESDPLDLDHLSTRGV